MRYFLGFFLLLLVGSLQEAKAGTPAVAAVRIGDVLLHIPSEYLLPDLPSSMVPMSELDDTYGISLNIPYSHMGQASSYSDRLKGNLLVFISSLGPYMRDHGVSMDAYRAWTGTGLFRKRVIEPDKFTPWYRVGTEAAYPMFWHLFARHPVSAETARNTWIASCYQSIAKQPTCHTYLAIENIQSELTVSSEQVTRLSDLKEAYRKLLLSWIEGAE